jgi:hypothetical protein
MLPRCGRSLLLRAFFITVTVVSVFKQAGLAQARGNDKASPGPPHRRYQDGETLSYRMRTSNRDATGTITYEAECHAQVTKDPSGNFYERYSWRRLNFDGKTVPLPIDGFHEDLSLDPEFKLSVPNLRLVPPALIGPITDLLTFYADAQLAMRQGRLVRTGDRVYVPNGKPNSWADARSVVLGEDAIDFDIVFERADHRTATVVVRHVPPQKPRIQIPAPWMRSPVVDHEANNWVEVSRAGQGYIAAVGEETFDVDIVLSRTDGKILSASMVNPVEVKQRRCMDAQLTECGKADRYEILRKVRIDLQP